jgi:hypothetical protein
MDGEKSVESLNTERRGRSAYLVQPSSWLLTELAQMENITFSQQCFIVGRDTKRF